MGCATITETFCLSRGDAYGKLETRHNHSLHFRAGWVCYFFLRSTLFNATSGYRYPESKQFIRLTNCSNAQYERRGNFWHRYSPRFNRHTRRRRTNTNTGSSRRWLGNPNADYLYQSNVYIDRYIGSGWWGNERSHVWTIAYVGARWLASFHVHPAKRRISFLYRAPIRYRPVSLAESKWAFERRYLLSQPHLENSTEWKLPRRPSVAKSSCDLYCGFIG